MLRTLRLPLQLVAVIFCVALFGQYFSSDAVRFFYTVSYTFKELLGLLLPFILFSFIASGILSIKRAAPLILLILLICIFTSNVIVTICSYLFVKLFLPIGQTPSAIEALQIQETLDPYVYFSIPNPFDPTYTLFFGTLTGIIFSMYRCAPIERTVFALKKLVETVLLRFFIPLLPLYIFGYLLEIKHRNILGTIFQHYSQTIMLILSMQFIFMISYFMLAKLSVKRGWQAFKNALPSYLTAVSTISSTATIPVTVECADKNTDNRPLAEMSIPLMANVHLMGAGINIPILSLATLILFKCTLPDTMHYLGFVGYFCTSMFAVTGIPGAAIFVMMPLLKDTFAFTPIMISVLTTLYLLMDATSAGTNVMGDGALIIIVNKILKKLKLSSD